MEAPEDAQELSEPLAQGPAPTTTAESDDICTAQWVARRLTLGECIMGAVASVLVPGVWLLLASSGSGAAFASQVIVVALGFVAAMIASWPLALFRKPLQPWMAAGIGSLIALVFRVIVSGLAGRVPEGGVISGVELLGGAVGGLALWFLKSALSGTAHYGGSSSGGARPG